MSEARMFQFWTNFRLDRKKAKQRLVPTTTTATDNPRSTLPSHSNLMKFKFTFTSSIVKVFTIKTQQTLFYANRRLNLFGTGKSMQKLQGIK